MKRLISIFFLCALFSFSNGLFAAVADHRDKATDDRAIKLRRDFRAGLIEGCPRLGFSPSSTNSILDNLEAMVPREGLLGDFRKSNSVLSHLPGFLGGVGRDDFPDMIEMREGILIIEKCPDQENISLTAFYSAEITDQETEKETIKAAKDVARTSKWAYRFVFRSRIKAGYSDEVVTVKPIFLLKYRDQIPVHIRILNDSKVFIRGDCTIKKLEIIARDTGVLYADNLMVQELIVDQQDQTKVELKGTAKTMDLTVDDKSSFLGDGFKVAAAKVNLSRGSCKEVRVHPTKRLIRIGELDKGKGTFTSVNPSVTEEDGSVVLRNIKNMGKRVGRVTFRSVKAISLGTGWISWQIIKLPYRFLKAVGKRIANAKVGVGASIGVGPVKVGAGVLI